ncbi:MAG: metallophosphoesterase [Sandaracinaceae bacterium]|nr:metallophosphoesterase [Sandaracinaceae bacterium]
MPRTLVVGDVHGCSEELRALLQEAGFRAGDDRLVSVGDLVNKGPDSAGVVRLVRSVGGLAVLGNHDDLILRCAAARRAGDDTDFSDGVRRVVKRLEDAELAWLERLPVSIALEEHHVIVVHAGLLPNVPLSSQSREHQITMRSIRSDGSGTKRLEEGVAWASLWPGPEHVLFGHDAVRGLQRWPYATGLDTGCVYGGRLTAMWLPERRLVSVPATRQWSEPGKSVAKQQARDGKALKKR